MKTAAPLYRTIRLAALTPFLPLLASCAESGSEPGATQFSDSAGIQIAHTTIGESSPTCEVSAETLRIGTVEGEEESLLLWLSDAARLSDGRIVAVSRGTSEMKVFSPSGELLARFGGSGGGPGEFKNLWSVDVGAGDTLVVSDYRPWRFNYFTPEGEFIRSVQPEPPIIERPDVVIPLPSGGGYLIGEACCYPENGFHERKVTLQSYTPEGSLDDSAGTFWYDVSGWLSQEMGYLGPPIFGVESSVLHYRDDLLAYAPSRHEQVEIHDIGGRLIRIVRWQGRDRTVQPEDADEWKRWYLERFPSLNDPERRPLKELHVGDDRPISELFPGSQGMVIGSDGTIWVKEYRRPFDTGPASWFAFDEVGTFLCQARVPEDFGILDAGDDYLLGRETDEFDVEYLVMRGFTSPG